MKAMRNEECVMRNGGAAHNLYSAANLEKREKGQWGKGGAKHQ